MKRRDFIKSTALFGLGVSGAISAGLIGPASAQGKSVFTLSFPSGFPDLDPATSFSGDGAILSNTYEGLTRYIPAFNGKPSRVDPLLAESWTVSDDGLAWTFKLRSGVTFHDGEVLTAVAVKSSIERTKKIGGGAAFIWSEVTEIETPDDLTVVIKLSSPQPIDLIAAAGFASWIMSPAALTKDNAWFNAGNNAGTGPYMIERYDPGQRAILTRHEKYWGGFEDGNFDKVVFDVVEDAVLSQSKMEGGQADWTYNLPYENLDSLKAKPELDVVINPSFQTLFGLYNVAKPPLNDKKVRQVLSMAFPYDDVIKAGTNGLGSRAKGVIPPGIWGHDPDAPVPSLDIKGAKTLLIEAGITELELTMTYAVGDNLQSVAGELWKANLAKLGITLNLQPMAWEAQWQLAKSDPTKAQDIFVMYWWPTYITPNDYLFSLFHSEDKPNFNLGYYKNPAFDTLVNSANTLAGSDRAKAEAKFIEAQRLMIDDTAAVFMLDQPNVHIIRKDIKGYIDNPAYGHVTFVRSLTRG